MVIEASAAPAAVGVEAADLPAIAAAAAPRLHGGRDDRDRRPRDADPWQRDGVLIVRVFMKWSNKKSSFRNSK